MDRTNFRIWRKGEHIGQHEIVFDHAADGLHVSSQVEIIVKVAFLTAFKFEQEAQDHWRDNILVQSLVRTDDDGEKALIEMKAEQNSVVIDGPKGLIEAPKGTMTDVCFWNPNIVGQQQLLDTTKGELKPVSSKFIGEENLNLTGGSRLTKRYWMQSDAGRSGDIWFDEAGNWVGAVLTTRGETLEYERV